MCASVRCPGEPYPGVETDLIELPALAVAYGSCEFQGIAVRVGVTEGLLGRVEEILTVNEGDGARGGWHSHRENLPEGITPPEAPKGVSGREQVAPTVAGSIIDVQEFFVAGEHNPSPCGRGSTRAPTIRGAGAAGHEDQRIRRGVRVGRSTLRRRMERDERRVSVVR